MLDTRRLLVFTVLAFATSLGASIAVAEEPSCYTIASLKGTYAVVGTYGANVARALALRQFDGQGNLTGTFILNEPDPASTTGGRKLVTGTQVGTYTINCDGTGVITRLLSTSTGVVTMQYDNFVVTKAVELRHGELLATALEDMTQTASAIVQGGVFLVRSYTRLPD